MTPGKSALPTLPMLRASSLRDCPRKAILEATDTPKRDRTEREQRILYRGKTIGRDYLIMLATTRGWKIRVDSGPSYWVPPELAAHDFDTADVVAEKRVRWQYGTGHMDGFVIETGTVLEVLSSAYASATVVHSKTLQCVLYMEHDPDAMAGAVVVVNPSDLSEEVFPVAKTSRVYPELVAEVRERVAQVQAWALEGTLPARVCSKPNDAIGHFCLHAETCFQDWVAPELPVLADAGAHKLVAALYDAKTEERAIRARLAMQETSRKEIEQQLDDLVPVGRHRVGSLEVLRTHVERGPTVDLKKAELAGFPVESLDEFSKPGASYDVFKVERAVDVVAEDFGDDAPWTASDLGGEAA